MKRVYQSIVRADGANIQADEPCGDCFRACIASFLELHLEDVPHFMEIARREDGDDSFPRIVSWLRERGYTLLRIHFDRGTGSISGHWPIDSVIILSGRSPRCPEDCERPWNHAVLGRILDRWGSYTVEHDPVPQGVAGAGTIGELTAVYILVPLPEAN